MKCPKCAYNEASYEQVRWWEKPIRALRHQRPFRCRLCDVRYWA